MVHPVFNRVICKSEIAGCERYTHRETVKLEACAQTSACFASKGRRAGGICPECRGAVLTNDEIRFTQVPKVGG